MKRILSFLLCLILLLTPSIAYAADEHGLQVIGYQFTESSMDVMFYAEEEEPFTEESFTLVLDGKELSADTLQPYSDSNYSTSWIVIVEPTSSPETKLMTVAIVQAITERFRKNDNMAVYNAYTGTKTEFQNTESTLIPILENALSAGERENQTIKLYDTVNSALVKFKSDKNLNEHKCLLIVSRLIDSGSSNYFNDLCREAADLPITIYTVGLTDERESLEKALEKFSALSSSTESGLAISAGKISEKNAAAVAKPITDNEENHFYTLSIPFSEKMLSVSSSPVTLNILLQLKNSQIDGKLDNIDGEILQKILSEKNIKSHEHKWKDATCTEPKTCSLCGETEGEALGHDYSDASFFKRGSCSRCGDTIPSTFDNFITWAKYHLVVAIMAGILLLGLVVLIVILLMRKKQKIDSPEDEGKTLPVSENRTRPISKVTITLTNAKTGEQFSGDIRDTTIKAGRNAPLALKGDPSISGTHMEFVWQNGCLYVQDAKSTNGTILNGKEIKGAVALNQNDMIHVGTSDFRVNWHSNR